MVNPSNASRSQASGFITAVRLLFPLGAWPTAAPSAWRGAIWWLLPLGLGIGLLWAGVFRGAWRVFGEVAGLRLIPALLVLTIDAFLLGSRQYWGMARSAELLGESITGGYDRETRVSGLTPVLVLVMVVLTMLVLFVSMPDRPGYWPGGWRAQLGLNALYPRPIFHPLILAPIWGRWALILAGSIGRAQTGADVQHFCAAVSPRHVMATFVLATLLTIVYCSQRGNVFLGMIVSLIVLGVTHPLASTLGRRLGGQNAATLFAVSKVAEITFLFAYLKVSTTF